MVSTGNEARHVLIVTKSNRDGNETGRTIRGAIAMQRRGSAVGGRDESVSTVFISLIEAW
jgi:hypothetical protein